MGRKSKNDDARKNNAAKAGRPKKLRVADVTGKGQKRNRSTSPAAEALAVFRRQMSQATSVEEAHAR